MRRNKKNHFFFQNLAIQKNECNKKLRFFYKDKGLNTVITLCQFTSPPTSNYSLAVNQAGTAAKAAGKPSGLVPPA